MEKKETENTNGFSPGLKLNISSDFDFPKNLTNLDLSNARIGNMENLCFPVNLSSLNISKNSLTCVPANLLKLKKIKVIDLSHNIIDYFDDTPDFLHTIEHINLAYNNLLGPPCWIWYESPENLKYLDLHNNINITNGFQKFRVYYEEFLHCKTSVTHLNLVKCQIGKYMKLLETFPKVKVVKLGIQDFRTLYANTFDHIPCEGLDQCYDIEILDLSNTNIYTIDTNINMYKKLVEINLASNNICRLPKEFGCLESLEVCILSYNEIMYLPDEIIKLQRLKCLKLDVNKLCMLPEGLCSLPNITVLDLYDNGLYEFSDNVVNLQELDLAMNYFEEPEDMAYKDKKNKLRINIDGRMDGRKIERERTDSACSSDTTDDELRLSGSISDHNDSPHCDRSSSPEDWDDDKYWVPFPVRRNTPPSQSAWLFYVKKKMEEGNFCPMDAHPVPMADQVGYEKLCNPTPIYESDGQFDDFSGDDS